MSLLIPVEQKTVNFNGAEILGVKANNGKIYVGVKWICKGIDMTEGQYQNQTRKINDDMVLSKGIANLQLPTNGGIQGILCIELDFLPLWLAKITITPNMLENAPDVADKLIEYQLKAKDVLAQAFLPKQMIQPSYAIDDPIQRAERWIEEQKEKRSFETKANMLEQKVEEDRPKVLFADSLQISKDSILVADLAKLLKQNGIDIGEKRLFANLREEGYLIKSGSEYNMPTQRSMELKIMEIKVGYRGSSDGTTKITRTPKITGKGQMYFINKFLGKNQAI